MKKIIQEHLGLNDIKIISIETNGNNEIEIRVKSTLKGTNCHQCGRKITKPYGHDRLLRLRHLSLLGSPVYVLVKLPRYQCDDCKKCPKTTQRPSWHKKNSSFHLLFLMKNGSYSAPSIVQRSMLAKKKASQRNRLKELLTVISRAKRIGIR
jgi:transposase